jgi:hypothetical protein
MPNQPIPNVIVGWVKQQRGLRALFLFPPLDDGCRRVGNQHPRPCSSAEQREYRGAHWQQERLSAHRAESRST